MLSIRSYALLAPAVVALAACGGGGSTNTGAGGGTTTGTGASTGSGASTTTSGTTITGSTTTSGTTTSGSTTTSGTTSSTTTTTSAASGACTDAADTTQLATLGNNLTNLVQGCAETNLGAEPATKNCIKQMTMLSDPCVACFDANVECAVQHCTIQCAGGMSAGCTSCLHTNCTPAFNTCSGLQGP